MGFFDDDLPPTLGELVAAKAGEPGESFSLVSSFPTSALEGALTIAVDDPFSFGTDSRKFVLIADNQPERVLSQFTIEEGDTLTMSVTPEMRAATTLSLYCDDSLNVKLQSFASTKEANEQVKADNKSLTEKVADVFAGVADKTNQRVDGTLIVVGVIAVIATIGAVVAVYKYGLPDVKVASL